MDPKNKSQLKEALVALVRSNGHNGKTKAADVRTLLSEVIDTIFTRVKTINGEQANAETGEITLTGIPLKVHQPFVVNPNLDTTDVMYLERGPVVFSVSYDENKISALSFRIRIKGEAAWSTPVGLAGLNALTQVLPAGTKFEVQVAPVFTAAAIAAAEDVHGLLIY